jgi:hypothetical protein
MRYKYKHRKKGTKMPKYNNSIESRKSLEEKSNYVMALFEACREGSLTIEQVDQELQDIWAAVSMNISDEVVIYFCKNKSEYESSIKGKNNRKWY